MEVTTIFLITKTVDRDGMWELEAAEEEEEETVARRRARTQAP